MTNDEYWAMNDGGEEGIGEKYREMVKDRSEDTQPKGLTVCFEVHVVGPGNDQSGRPTRERGSAKGPLRSRRGFHHASSHDPFAAAGEDLEHEKQGGQQHQRDHK